MDMMMMKMIMRYLTEVGLTPSGSSTVHIYTQHTEYRERNIHNNKKIRNVHNNKKILKLIWEVRTVPRLCELYPSVCLTIEEKARENVI
jgi:acetoacetate decarboxylase